MLDEKEIIETLQNLAVDKYIDERKLEEKDVEAIINIIVLYKQEKEKNKYSVSNELLINYMNIARKNSNVYLKLHNKKQALEEYKRYKILKDMIDYLIYNKPSLY